MGFLKKAQRFVQKKQRGYEAYQAKQTEKENVKLGAEQAKLRERLNLEKKRASVIAQKKQLAKLREKNSGGSFFSGGGGGSSSLFGETKRRKGKKERSVFDSHIKW